MKCVLAALTFIFCGSPAFSQDESALRNRLVGTWKLVSTVETLKNGTTRETLARTGRAS